MPTFIGVIAVGIAFRLSNTMPFSSNLGIKLYFKVLGTSMDYYISGFVIRDSLENPCFIPIKSFVTLP